MQPEPPKAPLADQPWFPDFLAGKGFFRSSPTTFTNGKATITIEDTKFSAYPGNGEHAWNGDFGEVDRATIKSIIEQILKMQPFLSEKDLAAKGAEKERLERALIGIAATVKAAPDSLAGIQLRRFLWSLYNGEHMVNLYCMSAVLDSKSSGWISEVFAGAFVGVLKEDDIKRALLAAGEMERWDQVRPDTEALEKLDQAERILLDLVRRTPPSHAHTELADLLSRFAAVKHEIRAQEPTR